jgi:hypothetical protein
MQGDGGGIRLENTGVFGFQHYLSYFRNGFLHCFFSDKIFS